MEGEALRGVKRAVGTYPTYSYAWMDYISSGSVRSVPRVVCLH